MFNGEGPKSENIEIEKSPEKVVDNAVSTIEGKDATDPILSSAWMQKGKKYLSGSAKIGGLTIVGLLGIVAITLFKAVEVSALLLKGAIENPSKPGKWLASAKGAFTKQKKK